MSTAAWRPRARAEVLAQRASLLSELRAFFAARKVMEVTPPLLSRHTVTAPAIESIRAHAPGYDTDAVLYLQTSPEYAMKRLLADGSGPVYAITAAFRDGELGPYHSPEFTLLEWYRPGFGLSELMDEVDALVSAVLGRACAERTSYRDAFIRHAGVDPVTAETVELRTRASALGLANAEHCSRDALLDFLLSIAVQPRLAAGLHFIYGYPPSQAALAELDPGPPASARRFELFADTVELANGYQELRDAEEQRARFESEREQRKAGGQWVPEVDRHLLDALAWGLPPVSGVALGVDRLLMLRLGLTDIRDALAFPLDTA